MLDEDSSVADQEYSGSSTTEDENYLDPHCFYTFQSSVYNAFLYFNFAAMFLLPTAVSKAVINKYFSFLHYCIYKLFNNCNILTFSYQLFFSKKVFKKLQGRLGATYTSNLFKRIISWVSNKIIVQPKNA